MIFLDDRFVRFVLPIPGILRYIEGNRIKIAFTTDEKANMNFSPIIANLERNYDLLYKQSAQEPMAS